MDKYNINFYTKISKVDEAKRMVYGYCTTESVDSHGEIVSKEAIRKAWQAYMEYGNVREMHQPSAVGVTKEYSHDEVGTWIGVKVVDDTAWEKVKEGVYKAFSIGGRVTLKVDNIIKGLILSEISLVDRPACPDAKITVIKIDDGLVNTLSLEAINDYKIMKKFIEIDGVKYFEDPDKAGEALIDAATGEKVVYTEEAPTETAEQKEQREKDEAEAEEKKVGDENEAKGLNRDGSAKEVTAGGSGAGAGAGEPVVPVVPAAPVTPPAGGEGSGDKLFKSSGFVAKAKEAGLFKDSEGVLMSAGLLDHLEYVISCFASEGKSVDSLIAVKSAIMEVIKAEANAGDADKGAKTEDLNKMAKMFSAEVLEKVGGMIDGKLGDVLAKVGEIAKEVEVIKNTKTSPRPKTAHVVEKTFEGGGESTKSVDEAKAEVDTIRKEIDDHAIAMKAGLEAEPGRKDEFIKKSSDLFIKLRKAEEILNRAVSGQ